MPYQDAFKKAYDGLNASAKQEKYTINFLADNYEVDLLKKSVFSISCNVLAPEHVSILVLHYLIAKLKGLPKIREEWISFQQLPGGQGYYDAFRRRSIEPLIRKFGKQPQNLLVSLERLPAKRIQYADCAICLEAFKNVPVMITVWAADEEFGAEANILFDRSIMEILPTEDVAVLAGFVAKAL